MQSHPRAWESICRHRFLAIPRLCTWQLSKPQSTAQPPPFRWCEGTWSSAPCPGGQRTQAVSGQEGSWFTAQSLMLANALGRGPRHSPHRSPGQSAPMISAATGLSGGSLPEDPHRGTDRRPSQELGSGALCFLLAALAPSLQRTFSKVTN